MPFRASLPIAPGYLRLAETITCAATRNREDHHSVPRCRAREIGCDRTARRAASLDAALEVRAQGFSLLGRLRPSDLGLLRIAELDTACVGGGKGTARARRSYAAPAASAPGVRDVELSVLMFWLQAAAGSGSGQTAVRSSPIAIPTEISRNR